MVLYFSATGNTKYMAEKIAEGLDDECLDLLDRIRNEDYSLIRSKKPFVICSPIYVCEMPRFFMDFLKNVKLGGNRNMYFVFTSGGYSGAAAMLAKRIARGKKGVYMGCADVRMASNYVASKRYGIKEDEDNLPYIRKAVGRIPEICRQVKNGERLKSRHVFLFEILVVLPVNPLWNRYMQPTSPFYTTDACIGCGKCVRLCPLHRIRMEEGRPLWSGSCAHCMACITNCPTEAIEYGDRTQGKPRYRLHQLIEKL